MRLNRSNAMQVDKSERGRDGEGWTYPVRRGVEGPQQQGPEELRRRAEERRRAISLQRRVWVRHRTHSQPSAGTSSFASGVLCIRSTMQNCSCCARGATMQNPCSFDQPSAVSPSAVLCTDCCARAHCLCGCRLLLLPKNVSARVAKEVLLLQGLEMEGKE